MKVSFRFRLNGRIPDPQGKYRDEVTQEATVELEGLYYESLHGVVADIGDEISRIKATFYEELNRKGGYDYREAE